MFSKSKTPEAKPVRPKAPTTPSLISEGLSVTGDLQSEGEIQIDGQISGDIECASLMVGESATVRGEIVADTVTIRGEVQGRVRGSEVNLAKTARVIGDVLHRTLSMEAGAHLEGQVKKVEDPRALPSAPLPKLLQTGGPTRLEAHEGGAGSDGAASA
ncbi:MAG: bactofilin family protein [Minwuia sp.]|uniref:bactofilin family protein n=1 Tax=Minwuia sp. TaxID=2493630 RepID=UPI003A8971EC